MAQPYLSEAVPDIVVANYRLDKTIGQGTYGKVKLGIHIKTFERAAVKVIEKAQIKSSKQVARLQREIRFLKLLHHPHIVKVYDVIETDEFIYIVMEYAVGGELFDYIVANKRVKEREARSFFRMVLSAIDYCHKNAVIHRDLKPENLLLDSQKVIKIIDFGFGNNYKSDGSQLDTFCGSPFYAAPEMILGKKYTGPEVDVWSLGVILFALLCGHLPFDDDNMKELYKKIASGSYRCPEYVPINAKHLIGRLIQVDPQKRATLEEALAHPWVNEGYDCEPPNYLPKRPIISDPSELSSDIINRLMAFGYKQEDILKAFTPEDNGGNIPNSEKPDAIRATYFLLVEMLQREEVKLRNQKRKSELLANSGGKAAAAAARGSQSSIKAVMEQSQRDSQMSLVDFSASDCDHISQLQNAPPVTVAPVAVSVSQFQLTPHPLGGVNPLIRLGNSPSTYRGIEAAANEKKPTAASTKWWAPVAAETSKAIDSKSVELSASAQDRSSVATYFSSESSDTESKQSSSSSSSGQNCNSNYNYTAAAGGGDKIPWYAPRDSISTSAHLPPTPLSVSPTPYPSTSNTGGGTFSSSLSSIRSSNNDKFSRETQIPRPKTATAAGRRISDATDAGSIGKECSSNSSSSSSRTSISSRKASSPEMCSNPSNKTRPKQSPPHSPWLLQISPTTHKPPQIVMQELIRALNSCRHGVRFWPGNSSAIAALDPLKRGWDGFTVVCEMAVDVFLAEEGDLDSVGPPTLRGRFGAVSGATASVNGAGSNKKRGWFSAVAAGGSRDALTVSGLSLGKDVRMGSPPAAQKKQEEKKYSNGWFGNRDEDDDMGVATIKRPTSAMTSIQKTDALYQKFKQDDGGGGGDGPDEKLGQVVTFQIEVCQLADSTQQGSRLNFKRISGSVAMFKKCANKLLGML